MSELKNEFGILEHLGFWMFTLGMPTLYVLLYFSKYEFGVVMHTLFWGPKSLLKSQDFSALLLRRQAIPIKHSPLQGWV
jgi:hypothetical protein